MSEGGGGEPRPGKGKVVDTENATTHSFIETKYSCGENGPKKYDTETQCKKQCRKRIVKENCIRHTRYHTEQHPPCFDDWCEGEGRCKYNYTSVVNGRMGYYCTKGQDESKCEADWFRCDCDDTHNSQCRKIDTGLIAGGVIMIVIGVGLLFLLLFVCTRASSKYKSTAASLNFAGGEPIKYLRVRVQ